MLRADRAQGDWARGWRAWLLAALFYLPMAAVVLAHLLLPPDGHWPTGFLQYDQGGYMAMAREYVDHSILPKASFGLPTSADPRPERIYSYPHLFVLGFVRSVTQADPGRLYLLFGALSGLVFLRLAIALYARAVPQRDGAALLGLGLFLWGGGLFVLAGLGASLADGRLDYNTPFRFDPEGGFWFLDLGRNLFYAVEAYYHAVVFGLLLALLDRRWLLALLLMALIASSHPFTGAQFLAIALAWTLPQYVIARHDRPPTWFAAGGLAILACFIAYHFWYLPRSAEHRAIMADWSLAWTLPASALALSCALLAPAALVTLARQRLEPRLTALLAVTAGLSLLLANHELFMTPKQPLHFTRGYIWFPLFLLAAPWLVPLLRRLLARHRLAAAALAGLFLLDNAAWLTVQAVQNAGGFGAARYLAEDERAILATLNRDDGPALLVSEDDRLSYDALIYTSWQSWYSHEHLTPFAAERRAELARWAATGEEPAAWRRDFDLVAFVTAWRDDYRSLPWVTADSSIHHIGDRLLVIRRKR
jgi:hypothetical protein